MLLIDARAAYLQKDYKRVLAHAERINRAGDTINQSIKLQAFSLYHLGRYEEAITWLKRMKDDQKAEQQYFYLSMANFRLNHLAKAEEYMQMAVNASVSPSLGDYYTQLGIVYEAEGKDRDAIGMYKKAYELTENENLLYRLALISEDYYADISIAEGYFEFYLAKSDSAQTFYREYARQRLDEIKAARFFDTDSI